MSSAANEIKVMTSGASRERVRQARGRSSRKGQSRYWISADQRADAHARHRPSDSSAVGGAEGVDVLCRYRKRHH